MAAPHGIVPKEMQDTFTFEQKEYLAGFLLAVAKRGETFFAGHNCGRTDHGGSCIRRCNLAAPPKEETWLRHAGG